MQWYAVSCDTLYSWAFGTQTSQCQGNLFGRPAPGQKVAHQPKQDAITVQFARRAVLLAAVVSMSAGRASRRSSRLIVLGVRPST